MSARKRIWLTDEQRVDAARRYAAGEPVAEIAMSLGVCVNNVYEAIHRSGGDVRGRVEAATRLAHRADAFDAPLTSEAEYWLGFLWADGWINWRKKSQSSVLHLAVAIKDREHLVKLRAFLGSEHKITEKLQRNIKFGKREVKPRWMSRIAIPSRRLTDQLLQLGMCTKSLRRIAPIELINSRDFWRGLVDGDGWLSIGNTGKARLGLCGGLELMTQFLCFLKHSNIETAATVRRQKKIFVVALNCTPAVECVRLLYTDTCSSLNRKNDRAVDILNRAVG